MRHFNIIKFPTGLSSGNAILLSKQMNTVDVNIEQINHKVFQQYPSHFGVLYTAKFVQSTVDEPWYNKQSVWNIENITNEPNLNS